MSEKIVIERKVVEWKHRCLFGILEQTWVLAPVEWTVSDLQFEEAELEVAEARSAEHE